MDPSDFVPLAQLGRVLIPDSGKPLNKRGVCIDSFPMYSQQHLQQPNNPQFSQQNDQLRNQQSLKFTRFYNHLQQQNMQMHTQRMPNIDPNLVMNPYSADISV